MFTYRNLFEHVKRYGCRVEFEPPNVYKIIIKNPNLRFAVTASDDIDNEEPSDALICSICRQLNIDTP